MVGPLGLGGMTRGLGAPTGAQLGFLGEEEKEKSVPDGEQMSRGEDAFAEEDPYHGIEQYLEDRPTLNTADAALLRSFL